MEGGDAPCVSRLGVHHALIVNCPNDDVLLGGQVARQLHEQVLSQVLTGIADIVIA